jgi:hypothetical protein
MTDHCRFDVFYPRDGITLFNTRSLYLARFVAWLIGGDYEIENQGWLELTNE